MPRAQHPVLGLEVIGAHPLSVSYGWFIGLAGAVLILSATIRKPAGLP